MTQHNPTQSLLLPSLRLQRTPLVLETTDHQSPQTGTIRSPQDQPLWRKATLGEFLHLRTALCLHPRRVSKCCGTVDRHWLVRPEQTDFQQLEQERQTIERCAGVPLRWQRLESQRPSRISWSLREDGWKSKQGREQLQDQLIHMMKQFSGVMDSRLSMAG